ncbi:hypothetical protein ACJJTC_018792, partial [Scirpophaga incertulas]
QFRLFLISCWTVTMNKLFIFVLFTFAKCAFGDEALLSPCAHEDSECIRRNTEKFLDRTSAGIPEYDVRPIDPLLLGHVEYSNPESDVVLHFKNIRITGLKKLNINQFSMNIDTRAVYLQAKIDVNIVANLTVEFKQLSKFVTDSYRAKTGVVLMTSMYNYNLVPNDKGVEFYEVGPETITCEAIDLPEVTVGSAIFNDPETNSRKRVYQTKLQDFRKQAVCKILSAAYVNVIHNIRATAKILPKTSFFTDV